MERRRKKLRVFSQGSHLVVTDDSGSCHLDVTDDSDDHHLVITDNSGSCHLVVTDDSGVWWLSLGRACSHLVVTYDKLTTHRSLLGS